MRLSSSVVTRKTQPCPRNRFQHLLRPAAPFNGIVYMYGLAPLLIPARELIISRVLPFLGWRVPFTEFHPNGVDEKATVNYRQNRHSHRQVGDVAMLVAMVVVAAVGGRWVRGASLKHPSPL